MPVPPTGPLHVAMTVEQCWARVPGGTGTYVVELARGLVERPDLTVTGVAARHAGPPSPDWVPAVPVRHSRLPRRLLYDAWQHLPGPRAESLAGGADVVHATSWAIPATRRPLLVTVHDLAFLHDRSHFTRRGNAFFRRALERTRAAARSIVVPSRATADDCVAAGLDARTIEVIPHGVQVVRPSAAEVAAARSRLGLPRDYVLWCGTVEPRKNVAGLLAGFAGVAAERPDVDLVLVGPRGWGGVPDLPDGLAERVRVLGPLPRADLDACYEGAAAFVFPSLREGFGLPVLEAMAHGVPVVTSVGTACAEVAGDAGILVNPDDAPAIGRGIAEALDARDELTHRSLARAARFTWAASAARHAAVYRAAAS